MEDREHGRDPDPALDRSGVGKGSLGQLRFGPGAHGPTKPGGRTLVEQLAPIPRGAGDARAQIQAALGDGASGPPSQRPPAPQQRELIPFQIIVARDMTGEEFKAAANLQVFGLASVSAEWKNLKHAYTPADSPVALNVEASLLRRVRGAANARKGIATDESGAVSGADARAQAFLAQPASDEKSALLAEIDRRYRAASGAPPGTQIEPGEAGPQALRGSIRDEVLFQHQYLANLPDQVKALIRTSIKGRELAPADHDQLFRIAKKLEALPPGAVADYASKITGSTTDLATFEATVDGYCAELATREREAAERNTAQNKLLGLEEVYKLYKRFNQATRTQLAAPVVTVTKHAIKVFGGTAETAGDLKQQLEQQLQRHGFTSIAEFAAYTSRFTHAFEEGAARLTLDILGKYAGKLYKESQRYHDPAVIAELHRKLGGFRAQHQELAKSAAIWNAYAKTANHDHERGRLPGSGHVHARPPTAEQVAAGARANTAKASAEAQLEDLAKEYPIFAEGDLPVDKRLDKVRLAQADEATLAGLLQSHIADRNRVVASAREQLEGKHALVYKLDKLMPTFYAEMGIQPGSVHDEIIQDKVHEDAVAKLVGGVLLGIAAVALTVVSLGTATPALVAAGASIGAAGLSTSMAYEEYKEYAAEHAMADAGLADDPSVAWLVLAIAGAGVDMAVAVKAVRALAPAAKALEAGGALADFTRVIEALEAAKQLERRAAEAAAHAAAARRSYQAAKGELGAALGKAYSLPGPLADPEVYRAVIKMAVAKIRAGGHSLSAFVADLRAERLAAKLGELTPEELARVKQAWEAAETIAKSAERPVDIIGESGRVIGRYSNGSHLEILSRGKEQLHGGNIIRLDPDATTTVTGALADVNQVAVRGERLPGLTRMGENQGSINILRSPKWNEIKVKHVDLLNSGDVLKYWQTVTDEFWEVANKPWLDEAIARGDKFRLVSNPADEKAIYVTDGRGNLILDNGNKIKSIFGREIDYLKARGYNIQDDGIAMKVR